MARRLLSILLSLSWLLSVAAWAAEPCKTGDTTAACRYGNGLLWKIERSGSKPSHVFGTIHLSDPRVTNLPRAVQETFDASSSFTMEVIFDGAGAVRMAERMFFDDGRTLESVLGAKRYAQVRQALALHKAPSTGIEKHKPWVIVMMLSMPQQNAVPLDFKLQLEATLKNKPTHGLETLDEQIAVFDDLSMDDQIAMLDSALRHQHAMAGMLESLTKAYLERDLNRLIAIMNSPEAGADNQRLHSAVMERLLAQRNVRMVERMRPRLGEGNAFIAVGAGHLPGDRGVLALLERAGWRVTRVY